MSQSTIFAPATAPGRAGVAVIRISGPEAFAAAQALAGLPLPPPRLARVRRFRDPRSDVLLDAGLLLIFPGPNSFTGEDIAEFHIHGGPAVVAAMVAALARLPGLRPAEAGEFTRRAFEAGRIDLTEVEGLADLIDAETEQQRRLALRHLEGGLSGVVEGWRTQLIDGLAWLESGLDFADEGDIPADTAPRALAPLRMIIAEISECLEAAEQGRRLRDGVEVALIGPPNAGKSSLLNALAGSDAAIVSSRPGTTRDVVEVRLDLGGYPVILADTAGLRAAADEIEDEGVRRALARAERADLVLGLIAADDPEAGAKALAGKLRAQDSVILNKCDLDGPAALKEVEAQETHRISAKTGEGLDDLKAWLQGRVVELAGVGEGVALTRARHRMALEAAKVHLERAVRPGAPLELLAEEGRRAAAELGRVTGRVDVEDILDRIFSSFCIGK